MFTFPHTFSHPQRPTDLHKAILRLWPWSILSSSIKRNVKDSCRNGPVPPRGGTAQPCKWCCARRAAVSVFKETCVYLWSEKSSYLMHSALLTGRLDGQNFLTPRNPVRTLCTAVIHNLCPSGVLAVHGIIRLHTSTQPRTGASSSHRTGGVQTHTSMDRELADVEILTE